MLNADWQGSEMLARRIVAGLLAVFGLLIGCDQLFDHDPGIRTGAVVYTVVFFGMAISLWRKPAEAPEKSSESRKTHP